MCESEENRALSGWLNSSFTACTATMPAVCSNGPGCFGKSCPSQISRSHGWELEIQLWAVYCLRHFNDHPHPLHRHGRMYSHLLLSGQTAAAWPELLAFSREGISAIQPLTCFCLGDKFLSKFVTKKCYVDMAFSDNSPAGAEHVSLPQRLRISRVFSKEVAESRRMTALLVVWC